MTQNDPAVHPLIERLLAEFKAAHGIDLSSDRMAMTRLNELLPKLTQELATATEAEIHLPFITADASGPKHLTRTVTKAEFDGLGDGFARTVE